MREVGQTFAVRFAVNELAKRVWSAGVISTRVENTNSVSAHQIGRPAVRRRFALAANLRDGAVSGLGLRLVTRFNTMNVRVARSAGFAVTL